MGQIWNGPKPIWIHCVGCPNHDYDLLPRPNPFEFPTKEYGHPMCIVVLPGEIVPPQHEAKTFDERDYLPDHLMKPAWRDRYSS